MPVETYWVLTTASAWRSRSSAQTSKPSRRATVVRTSAAVTSTWRPGLTVTEEPAPSTRAVPASMLIWLVSGRRSTSTRSRPGSIMVMRACGVVSSKSRSKSALRTRMLTLP